VLAAGCSDNKAAENKPAVPVTPHYGTATVEAQPVEQAVKLPAQLAAFLQVDIFPKVNGYVTGVLVDVGSHVRQGQVLMTLEAPELVQAVAQAREKYARAVADYTIDKENYESLKPGLGHTRAPFRRWTWPPTRQRRLPTVH
jgi:membrane fusion protein (multidrug efflux system)